MCELSTADGFAEINECVGDMIKYMANEPSVGLFYIQQHVQNAVPNVINLKNDVIEKSREINLHTEDLEDSIMAVGSMKEFGISIAEEMSIDIRNTLALMSLKQPRRGLIHHTSSGFQLGSTSPWAPVSWSHSTDDITGDMGKMGGYFSTVLKSAKHKAGNFKWRQLDPKESQEIPGERESYAGGQLSALAEDHGCPRPGNDEEVEELPVSSQAADEIEDEMNQNRNMLPGSDKFDEFKANREARLEEWLKDNSGKDH